MGIYKLGNLLYDIYGNKIVNKEYDHYKNIKLVVDSSQQLYKTIISIRRYNKGLDIKTKDGRVVTHIYGIFNKVFHMIENNVLGIWVFDGKPSELKENELNTRREWRKSLLNRVETNNYESEQHKIELISNSYSINKKDVTEIQYLLKLLGIPFIRSQGEADLDCASLCNNDDIYGVISEDWDVLLLGGKRLIRNYSKRKESTEYELSKILEMAGITYDMFVDICMLLGNDICPGINMNYRKLYKNYMKYKNITDTINHLRSLSVEIPEDFMEKYELAKEYYKTKRDYTKKIYNWNKPNYDELYKFLHKECEMEVSLLNYRINKIKAVYNRFNDPYYEYDTTKKIDL